MDTNSEGIGTDEEGNPVFPPVPASPEELSSTNRTVVIEPSSITVNVEMSRSTEYAKEKKSVSTYLKASIPVGIDVFQGDGEGGFALTPEFAAASDGAIKDMLNLCEVAAARQHGLEFVSDDAGIIRVTNLFPGTKAGPAPVAAGSFTAPAPLPGVAAPAPIAAAPAVAAPAAPSAAPVGTPFPSAPAAPAVAAPAPAGGFTQTKSDNPARWSFYDAAAQAQLIAQLEAWVTAGGTGEGVKNRMVAGERYPGVDVNGIQISGKTLKTKGGPQTQAWVAQCVANGLVLG